MSNRWVRAFRILVSQRAQHSQAPWKLTDRRTRRDRPTKENRRHGLIPSVGLARVALIALDRSRRTETLLASLQLGDPRARGHVWTRLPTREQPPLFAPCADESCRTQQLGDALAQCANQASQFTPPIVPGAHDLSHTNLDALLAIHYTEFSTRVQRHKFSIMNPLCRRRPLPTRKTQLSYEPWQRACANI
jgi:hypothetical protein